MAITVTWSTHHSSYPTSTFKPLLELYMSLWGSVISLISTEDYAGTAEFDFWISSTR